MRQEKIIREIATIKERISFLEFTKRHHPSILSNSDYIDNDFYELCFEVRALKYRKKNLEKKLVSLQNRVDFRDKIINYFSKILIKAQWKM